MVCCDKPLSLNLETVVFLFVAGVLGGALNAVAGGGSFIAFPALLLVGVPPIPANATNTIALWTPAAVRGRAHRKRLDVPRAGIGTLPTADLAAGSPACFLLHKTTRPAFTPRPPWA